MTERQPTPPLAVPLSVDIVDHEIFVDGTPKVSVSLTPDAAIETGIRLINAGMAVPEPTPEE